MDRSWQEKAIKFELQPFLRTYRCLRAPDLIIAPDEEPYLYRWHVFPRDPQLGNLYLHLVVNSDQGRSMHDHPWDNQTLVLAGGYDEITPDGVKSRQPGDVVFRSAEALHRLELRHGEFALTLFKTGPTVREWGFQTPNGWVNHKVATRFVEGNKNVMHKEFLND